MNVFADTVLTSILSTRVCVLHWLRNSSAKVKFPKDMPLIRCILLWKKKISLLCLFSDFLLGPTLTSKEILGYFLALKMALEVVLYFPLVSVLRCTTIKFDIF